jgi:hypothetical protein
LKSFSKPYQTSSNHIKQNQTKTWLY